MEDLDDERCCLLSLGHYLNNVTDHDAELSGILLTLHESVKRVSVPGTWAVQLTFLMRAIMTGRLGMVDSLVSMWMARVDWWN